MLVTVTVWLGEVDPTLTGPKSRLVGVIRNCGLTPVPLSVMLKFWPFQSPLEAVLAAPAAVGEKLKTVWQRARGVSGLPWQLWKPKKGEPTPPPAPDISTGLGPIVVTVTVWLGDVVPNWTEPKSTLVGVIRNFGLTPVPLSVMLKFWPFQSPDEMVPAGPAAAGEKS